MHRLGASLMLHTVKTLVAGCPSTLCCAYPQGSWQTLPSLEAQQQTTCPALHFILAGFASFLFSWPQPQAPLPRSLSHPCQAAAARMN